MKISRPIRFAVIAAGLAGGWFAAGLLGDHGDAPAPPKGPASAPSATRPAATRPATVAPAGTIRGRVLFRGTPPVRKPVPGIMASKDCAALHKELPLDETVIVGHGGGVRNAVVFLKLAPDGVPAIDPADRPPVVVAMTDCLYKPHVVAIQVGQKLLYDNVDPFLHSVHELMEQSEPRARAMPRADAGPVLWFKVKSPETFKVKCDVHPWMNMWVAAFDHPYFAVTGDDGAYEITGLPHGEYTVVAWQEKYKERERTVVVPPGRGGAAGAAEVDFTYEPVE